jgi:hypothetical protein
MFLNSIETRGRTSLDERSAQCKGLYLHRITQHINTKTNMHASSGIRTNDPSNQTANTYAFDHQATRTGICQHMTIFIHLVIRRYINSTTDTVS